MEQPAKPGVVDRLRARYGWFDHVMRAQGRYRDSKGDFFAAAVTYFTVFALFPLTMVGFSIGGFVLANRPDLLARLEGLIRTAVSGDMGQQVIEVMNSAIESRTSVGLIGLATAASGLPRVVGVVLGLVLWLRRRAYRDEASRYDSHSLDDVRTD